jgi:hypothetical protein
MFGSLRMSSSTKPAKEDVAVAARRAALGTSATMKPSARTKRQPAEFQPRMPAAWSGIDELLAAAPVAPRAVDDVAPLGSVADRAARRALLQTSATIRTGPDRARGHWDQIRQSDEVTSALASRSWGEVLQALRANEVEMARARLELDRRKEQLAAIDTQLAQHTAAVRAETFASRGASGKL